MTGLMRLGNRSTTISGVSPDPSGIGSSGISSTPRRGVAATDGRTGAQVAAIARIIRLNLKNGLRLWDMVMTPHRIGWNTAWLAAARSILLRIYCEDNC